jgi:hypothetical protein
MCRLPYRSCQCTDCDTIAVSALTIISVLLISADCMNPELRTHSFAGVGRGYLNNPEQTNKRFVSREGKRYYRFQLLQSPNQAVVSQLLAAGVVISLEKWRVTERDI